MVILYEVESAANRYRVLAETVKIDRTHFSIMIIVQQCEMQQNMKYFFNLIFP